MRCRPRSSMDPRLRQPWGEIHLVDVRPVGEPPRHRSPAGSPLLPAPTSPRRISPPGRFTCASTDDRTHHSVPRLIRDLSTSPSYGWYPSSTTLSSRQLSRYSLSQMKSSRL